MDDHVSLGTFSIDSVGLASFFHLPSVLFLSCWAFYRNAILVTDSPDPSVNLKPTESRCESGVSVPPFEWCRVEHACACVHVTGHYQFQPISWLCDIARSSSIAMTWGRLHSDGQWIRKTTSISFQIHWWPCCQVIWLDQYVCWCITMFKIAKVFFNHMCNKFKTNNNEVLKKCSLKGMLKNHLLLLINIVYNTTMFCSSLRLFESHWTSWNVKDFELWCNHKVDMYEGKNLAEKNQWNRGTQ